MGRVGLLDLDPLDELAQEVYPVMVLGIETEERRRIIIRELLNDIIEFRPVARVPEDGEVERAEDALLAG